MTKSTPTRRELLEGRLLRRPRGARDGATVHISSAVVTVLPDRRDEIVRKLSDLPEVEVHHTDKFKIVIVLEADAAGAIGSRLAEIAIWDGVLSANMVFEQSERLSDIGD